MSAAVLRRVQRDAVDELPRRSVGCCVRAVLRRCPWCGARRTFIHRLVRQVDAAGHVASGGEREEGFELGAMTINTIVTFVACRRRSTVGFIATSPDIPVVPMVPVASASRSSCRS